MLLQLIFQAATAAGVAGGAPAPAAATAPATVSVASTVSSTQTSNQQICKAEAITGSRVGGFRVCMTKAEWDARARASGDTLGQIQQNSLQFSPR